MFGYISSLNTPVIILLVTVCIISILLYINSDEKQESFSTSSEPDINNNPPSKLDGRNSELALYYTTWCGYSKAFAPEWQNLKEYVKTSVINLKLTEHDCDKEADLCEKYNVPGFPTIILHTTSGKSIHYSGDRTIEGILNFVKDNAI